MKNYVCIRFKKCSSWGDGNKAAGVVGLGGLTKHDLRLIDTPNADEKRHENNLICTSDTNWKVVALTRSLAERIGADRDDFFSAKARRRMESLGIPEPARPDTVRTINFMAMVSPEWLRNGEVAGPLDAQKSNQFCEAAAEFFRQEYEENFLGCVIHMDELNPHCSAYVLPAKRKIRRSAGRPRKDASKSIMADPKPTWGLSAKSMLTPDERVAKADSTTRRIYDSGTCSSLQTKFADFCKARGMEVVRGIHGSRARHKDIQENNHLLRSPVAIEEDIARSGDIEQLRKIALQNLLKAREGEELWEKLNLSIESERQARQTEFEQQRKLFEMQKENQEMATSLRRIFTSERKDILQQVLEQLRLEFGISFKIAAAMAAKGRLHANPLGQLVVARFRSKKIVGYTIQNLKTFKVSEFGKFGVSRVLYPKSMESIIIAAQPLEALIIATSCDLQAGNKTGVFMIGPADNGGWARAVKAATKKTERVQLVLPDDPRLAKQLELAAEQLPQMRILRPPAGFPGWRQLLRPQGPDVSELK